MVYVMHHIHVEKGFSIHSSAGVRNYVLTVQLLCQPFSLLCVNHGLHLCDGLVLDLIPQRGLAASRPEQIEQLQDKEGRQVAV